MPVDKDYISEFMYQIQVENEKTKLKGDFSDFGESLWLLQEGEDYGK